MKRLGTVLGVSALLAMFAVVCRGLMALYHKRTRKWGR